MPRIDHDTVIDLIREAAETRIMPLWRNLEEGQVMEKGLGDVVTQADRECEVFLGSALQKLLQGSLVVGEEAFAADRGVMDALDSERPVWVLDPLDGTRNFARHRGPFGVMVCLLLRGETLAAWIYDPLESTLLTAERGGGSYLAGERVTMPGEDKAVADMTGGVMVRYLPEELKEHAIRARDRFARVSGSGCAAYDYRQLVRGAIDFLFYYRTLIWDHAPGVLILDEAGGYARRYNGEIYHPQEQESGLLCAGTQGNWQQLRDVLLPPDL